MKNFLLTLVLLLGAVPLAGAQARQPVVMERNNAVIIESPWELSVQGGGVFPRKDDRFDDTTYTAGRLTYDVTPNVAVGVESGWLMFKDEVNGTKFGRIDGIPALGEVQLKMPIPGAENRIVPYVLGGAGVIFWNYREAAALKDAGVKVDTETHFAAKGAAGIDFYLCSHVALFVEGSYLFSRFAPKVHGGGTTVTAKADADGFTVGGGLKLRF